MITTILRKVLPTKPQAKTITTIHEFENLLNIGKRDFRKVCLSGIDLSHIAPENLCLQGAILQNVKLPDHLSQVNLSHTHFISADLSFRDLSEAVLTGANLSGANLTHANLLGAQLSKANLRYANLSWAYLPHANLSGSDLTLANLTGADLYGTNLANTRHKGAEFHLARLPLSRKFKRKKHK
jgi:uncharacterized protein YjbI with pentapeptide repeats